MSRGIPPVRSWCVRFYRGRTLVNSTIVETINKRFARWLANEKLGYPEYACDQITVTLVRGKRHGSDCIS